MRPGAVIKLRDDPRGGAAHVPCTSHAENASVAAHQSINLHEGCWPSVISCKSLSMATEQTLTLRDVQLWQKGQWQWSRSVS